MSSEISASVGGFVLSFLFLGCLYFFFLRFLASFLTMSQAKKPIQLLMVWSVKEDGEEGKLTCQVKAS